MVAEVTRRSITAIHEAGHAVGFEVCGYLVSYAMMTPDGSEGECFECGHTATPKKRVYVVRSLAQDDGISVLTGPLAEAKFTNKPMTLRGKDKTQVDAALELFRYPKPDPNWTDRESLAFQIEYVESRAVDAPAQTLAMWTKNAQHIINRHWTAINAIADVILEHGRIEGDHVRKIMRQTPKDWID